MEEAQEDNLLVQELQQGNKDALHRIYEKYKGFLIALASNLLNDKVTAEDVVHDAFVSFAASVVNLKLRGSLKYYLATCVVNQIRDINRRRRVGVSRLDEARAINSAANNPVQSAILSEELQRTVGALAQLPHEQRKVVIMHVQIGMTFEKIAEILEISANTAKSRYWYGVQKMRACLESDIPRQKND